MSFTVQMDQQAYAGLRARFSRRRAEDFTMSVHATSVRSGMRLRNRIRGNIGSRPGPLNRTGGYRASWRMQVLSVMPTNVLVFTNHPAARRLEYGFTGTDALGRRYDQPPYPHVRPAILEAEAEHVNAQRKNLARA